MNEHRAAGGDLARLEGARLIVAFGAKDLKPVA